MKNISVILAGIPRPTTNPHRAVIHVQGEVFKSGHVAGRDATDGGVFFPEDSGHLAEVIQNAILVIEGDPTQLPICNIQQCCSSGHHWNFDYVVNSSTDM
jgi:hypothetical protein